MTTPVIRRSTPLLNSPEFRIADSDGSPRSIGITPIVFERESAPIAGLFREIVSSDVEIQRIEGRDILMLHQHNSAQVLGREWNETMTMTRSDQSIHMVARESTDFPLQYWDDAFNQVRSGLVDGASFSFRPIREDMIPADPARYGDDYPRVRIRSMQLIEGSPVTAPAYIDTSVDRFVRDAYQAEFERLSSLAPSKSYRPLRVKRERELWLSSMRGGRDA